VVLVVIGVMGLTFLTMQASQRLTRFLGPTGACRVYPTRDGGRLAAKPQTRRIDEVGSTKSIL
jgi:hypothetical protein